MSTIKFLEIRDRGTRLPWCAGFGMGNPMVIFGNLENPLRTHYDPFQRGEPARTLFEAHRYVADHWDEIKDGDVIDVEFILGETTTKKESELHV